MDNLHKGHADGGSLLRNSHLQLKDHQNKSANHWQSQNQENEGYEVLYLQ